MTVAASAETVQPLAKGALAPDAQLTDINGISRSLYELIDNKPAVIVFYRGNW